MFVLNLLVKECITTNKKKITATVFFDCKTKFNRQEKKKEKKLDISPTNFFLDPLQFFSFDKKKMVLVLLSASVEIQCLPYAGFLLSVLLLAYNDWVIHCLPNAFFFFFNPPMSKNLLVWVKYLGKHTLFLSQFGLVCVQILGVELTRVSLHYKKRVSTTLHAALGLFTQEKIIEAKYTHKKFNLFNFNHNLRCFVAILRSLRFMHFCVKFGL